MLIILDGYYQLVVYLGLGHILFTSLVTIFFKNEQAHYNPSLEPKMEWPKQFFMVSHGMCKQLEVLSNFICYQITIYGCLKL
jgi:hypothetical protein